MAMESAPTAAGEATRQRILEAARSEFAEHGLAGARIDTIALSARASKERLYAYFRTKEELFRTVLADTVSSWLTAVPFTVDDLPGYTVALHDHFWQQRGDARLILWGQLSQHAGSTMADPQRLLLADRVDAIAAGQASGRLSDRVDARRLLTLILGFALSWFLDPDQSPTDPIDAAERDARRVAMRAGVNALVQP
jgi:AcrR family transcriptional regulator